MLSAEHMASLPTFVQVADARSFVHAGRALGVSASAVGKSIARLEQQVGVRLFHRSTRSVTLTAEGELLLVRARRVLAELEAAHTELSQQAAAPQGTLRVSLPQVSDLLFPLLADFMQAYPGIQLELNFCDRLVDVIEEGFDAVLRVAEPSDSRLSARRLGVFRRLLVASPDYLARHGTPTQPADLLHHHCLHYRYQSSGKLEHWPLILPDGHAALELPVTMISNTVEARVDFAQRGCGIAYLPEHAVRHALQAGQLVVVLPNHIHACGSFHLLWPSGRHALPKLRAFIDFVSERLPMDEGVLEAGVP